MTPDFNLLYALFLEKINATKSDMPGVTADINGRLIAEISHQGKTVFMAVDALHHEGLSTAWRRRIKQQAGLGEIDWTSHVFSKCQADSARGTFPPIMQEIQFHLQHVLNSLTKLMPGLKQGNLDQLMADTLLQLESEVLSELHPILDTAYQKESEDARLNKIKKDLDEKRKGLYEKARAVLMTALSQLPEFNKTILNEVSDESFDHVFAVNGAFKRDYCLLNAFHQIEYAEAASHVSHDKGFGKRRVTFRRSHHAHMKLQGGNRPLFLRAAQKRARLSSLVSSTQGNKTPEQKQAIWRDVASKLAYCYQKIGADNGVVSYYLLTSLYETVRGKTLDKKNKQTDTADHTFMAAHFFNQTNRRTYPHMPWRRVLVQNIGVNLRGVDQLKQCQNATVNEADIEAKMTFVYMLANLFPLNHALSKARDDIFQYYDVFLDAFDVEAPAQAYLHRSDSGRDILSCVARLQQAEDFTILANQNVNTRLSFRYLAARTLLRAFQTGEYASDRFGKLIQSLSIFLAPQCFFGCKSANERYGIVKNRVDMLDAMSEMNAELPYIADAKREMTLAMVNYLNSQTSNLNEVRACQSRWINVRYIHGVGCATSCQDAGASIAINTNTQTDVRTNSAEDFEVKLSQKKLKKYQGHKVGKKLRKQFRKKGWLNERTTSKQSRLVPPADWDKQPVGSAYSHQQGMWLQPPSPSDHKGAGSAPVNQNGLGGKR